MAEKQLLTKTVFDGKVIRVSLDSVECENGNLSTREVVHHNGGVCILAVNDGKVLVEKQYRYAVDKVLYELPAGKLERGENPYDAGMRELEEETGYKAEKLIDYGLMYPTCGYSAEAIYLYKAEGLTKSVRHLDDDEQIDVVEMPLCELKQMIADGTVTDAKTICLVAKYLLKQKEL